MNRARLITWGRRHPLLSDAALGVLAVAFSTGAGLYGPTATTHQLNLLGGLFAVLAVGAVTVRRRYPLVVFGVLSLITLLSTMFGSPRVATGGALLVAAWTIGASRSRTVSVTAAGITSVALLIRSLVAEGLGGVRAQNLNMIILTLLATAAGIAVRDRRAYLAALVERADRAERTRETEAARRVAEERLRIARDLHDSLAHHMAVVNVQAGVAQHLLRIDPEAAETALGHARTAAGQVLDELGTVLGVLRSTGDGDSTEPVPSLGRLSGLIEPLRSAGLDLRSTVVGRPRQIPPAVDQAAYRLVQEALTNVQKHAPSSKVSLTIEFRTASVGLLVVNSGIEKVLATTDPVGFGLAGMQERCAAVGGRLETGRVSGGGFRVWAELPAAPEAGVERTPDQGDVGPYAGDSPPSTTGDAPASSQQVAVQPKMVAG